LVALAGVAGALTYFVVLPMLDDKPVPETPTVVVDGGSSTPAPTPVPGPASSTTPTPAPGPATTPVPDPAPAPAPAVADAASATIPADLRDVYERYMDMVDRGASGEIYDQILDPNTKKAVTRDQVAAIYDDRAARFGRGNGARVVRAVAYLTELPFQPNTYGPYYYVLTETRLAQGTVADGAIFRRDDNGGYVLADMEVLPAAPALTPALRDEAIAAATSLFQGLEQGSVPPDLMVSNAPDSTEWFDRVQSMRGGDLNGREVEAAYAFSELLGEKGEYAYVQFKASFSDAGVLEQAWLKREGGKWKVARYWSAPNF
ncbi:MAG: hypothetical protein PHS60_08315, partial [Zavarzinia sp.]|nr:hypothetical protein [Zavarzinia sp.]